jgi:hypothetical protein
MITLHRRFAALAGLGLGFAFGQGCYDGVTPQDTDASGSTGLQLCQAGLVTCPDGSCHAPAPGACCGFGGLCPPNNDETTTPDPTMPPTTMPPTTMPPLDSSSTDETVSDTNTTSSSSSSSSSSDGTSSSSSSSSTGEGSTSTGELPPGCYDPLTFPWSGSLCGPAALPCVVQASETIEPLAAARSGTPTVAVDDDCAPSVLHAQSDGGALGFFAQRTGDDMWNVQATPFPMSQGGLDFDPLTGFFEAMVYEGGFQMSARVWDGLVWDAGDPLPGSHSLSTKAFQLTGDAVLHGVLQQPGVGFVDATWDAAWMLAAMPSGGPTDVSPSLAVAPDGTHQFTYWHSDVGGPALRWETTTGSLEEVMPYVGAVVQPALAQEIAITDDGAGGAVPHVIAGRETGVGTRVEVVYARRDGVAAWTTYVVAAEDPTGETTCDVAPTMPGEVCTLDRTTYRPLAIVSSLGGDVRWLYTDAHELVDYASECAPECVWVPTADVSTYDVRLGWLEGGVPTSVPLFLDTRLGRANAEIDGAGTMHVVAYAEEVPDGPGTGLTVEYFRVGP